MGRKKDRDIPIDDSPFFKSLRRRSLKLYLTKSGKLRKPLSQKDTYQRNVLEVCLRISSLLETQLEWETFPYLQTVLLFQSC